MKCVVENGPELAQDVENAVTFWARLKGLMFRRIMKKGTALRLAPCLQIHTCFMRFPIDVLFLDKNGTVLFIMENLKPWRLSPIVSSATQTLELPGGTLNGRVKMGQRVIFK